MAMGKYYYEFPNKRRGILSIHRGEPVHGFLDTTSIRHTFEFLHRLYPELHGERIIISTAGPPLLQKAYIGPLTLTDFNKAEKKRSE